MSDKKLINLVSPGGIPLSFRDLGKGEKIPHEVRPLAARAALFADAKAKAEKIGELAPLALEAIMQTAAREADISERAKAIMWLCPDLEQKEARALAELEPRLSFHPRAIKDHILKRIDEVYDALTVPAEATKAADPAGGKDS